MIFQLDLAGQPWEIDVPEVELDRFYRPFLQQLQTAASTAAKDRYLVYIAAPPGSGKTTLCAILTSLAAGCQSLPMDGFHLPNAILGARTITIDGTPQPLRLYKGVPESFDLSHLTHKLQSLRAGQSLRWPHYDRQRHDPIPDAIVVQPGGICLIEGNYLLLDEPGWRDLAPLADHTVYLDVPEPLVRQATIKRHIRGGRTPADALAHYERTDLRNRHRIEQHRLAPDTFLRVSADRRISQLR